MSKSGFSTLNRWLGRKNKDKSMGNGKLSKSSTNLSISSTNINETSQLEYNRITPLPAATTNAPFEQTFRITVLLPKDQLYVTRLGARVPLSKLLELVCDNKLLDEEKYEFRNPVDPSQVYSCDLTIGAVGLSEVRLCHKSESYDNFNSDEIIKLHRTSLIRESLSSSEFSSRNSKHTTKTTSPYSSTNSLNSMDSSAVSCGGRPSKGPPTKLTAPPRKKRAAPKPPKQTAIPEKCPLIMENGNVKEEAGEELEANTESNLTAKDLSISTPNLSSSTLLHSDINGNDCNGHLEDFNDESSGNGSLNSHGYTEDTVLYAQIQKKNALNSQSHGHVEVECGEQVDKKLPEPSPRKRIVVVKKKTSAPPAPPPRNSLYQEDNISLASTNMSGSSTPTTPIKSYAQNKPAEEAEFCSTTTNNNNLPTPLPRITTTSTTLLNATDVEEDIKLITSNGETEDTKTKANVSKVILNRTPTPEPRSLACDQTEEPPEPSYETQLQPYQQQTPEEDCVSKQADSGIGEPVPSPLPDSLPSEVSNLDVKLQQHFESSSDDDDMVKVYNFKLGKTLVKPVSETKTLEELTIMNSTQEETDSELSTPLILGTANTPQTISETSSWNFAIPISPPPNFADTKFVVEPQSDAPITPKITERPVLNFEALKQEHDNQAVKQTHQEMPFEIPVTSSRTPLENIVQELSSVISEKGVDSLIKKSEEPAEIEAAKPNTLSNFSINAIDPNKQTKPKEVLVENSGEHSIIDAVDKAAASPLSSPCSIPEEEKLYRKRNSVSSLKQRRSVTRSDSFHSTAAPFENLNLNKRTSSQLSLDQMAGNLNRRKSSSELSIGESPSLQSLEIIKTILNSRKNSLANSSGEEDKEIEVNACRPSDELKFASLELKPPTKPPENLQPRIETEVQETKKQDDTEQPAKELPRVYRYSGPPSINFSTWSERPKSQVAIKNEGDYIFGGGKSIQSNNNINRLTTRISLKEPPPVAPKPQGPIQRMGIPEKDYKVPILVKPLKEAVNEKPILNSKPQEMKPTKAQNALYNAQRPTVESVLKPQKQVLVNTLARAAGEPGIRPQSLIITNTLATLPRTSKQRYPAQPAAAAAVASAAIQQPSHTLLLRASSTSATASCTKQPYESEANFPPGPQILRSSSINREEIEKPSSPANTAAAPFGQNTLRRTGYKEKILAQEDKEQQQQQQQQKINHIQQNTICPSDLQQIANHKFTRTIVSAKLHLNLKNTNNNSSNNTTTQSACKTASPCYSSYASMALTLESSKLKLKPASTPQTAPALSSTNSAAPPAPPPPVHSIQLKTVTPPTVRTPTSADDPRDELLTAIRNFNREGLKKA